MGLVPLAAGALAVGVAGEASGVAARSSAAACQSPTAQPPNVGTGGNVLNGVAARGCKAWAVGSYDNGGRTLVEYWDGAAWTVQKSPNIAHASSNGLNAVAATSSTNAWAVGGYYPNYGYGYGLVEHWNGTSWKIQSHNGDGYLDGVAATSSRNAWAVGSYITYFHDPRRPVILHYNGKSWKAQKSPHVASFPHAYVLSGVAATSATNAWAVGYYEVGRRTFTTRTLVEHWNGRAWKVKPSPSVKGAPSVLSAVAATSRTSVWAVGNYMVGRKSRTLVLHWNGRASKLQKSPNPGGSTHSDGLAGVATTSPTNAWAVGSNRVGRTVRTLVLHWDGKGWKVQPSPGFAGGIRSNSNGLADVAATSPTNAWAVGSYWNGKIDQNIALHWNGTAWGP